ncbi:MAG: magnesium-dependent phosphatase-1 [Thermofilaceae archaeon]
MGSYKLLALDLDKTIWDHEDVSSTEPPYDRLNRDTISDSKGIFIKLRTGVREVLETLKDREIALAVVSWNLYSKAVAALEAFDLLRLFDLVIVEPHPRKDLMFSKLLEWSTFHGIKPSEIVFVDDNPEMVEKVKRAWPQVTVAMFGADVKSFDEVLRLVLDP